MRGGAKCCPRKTSEARNVCSVSCCYLGCAPPDRVGAGHRVQGHDSRRPEPAVDAQWPCARCTKRTARGVLNLTLGARPWTLGSRRIVLTEMSALRGPTTGDHQLQAGVRASCEEGRNCDEENPAGVDLERGRTVRLPPPPRPGKPVSWGNPYRGMSWPGGSPGKVHARHVAMQGCNAVARRWTTTYRAACTLFGCWNTVPTTEVNH